MRILVYESFLRKVLSLENGIPSYDILQHIFATLNPQMLVTLTELWSEILEEASLDSKSFPTFSKYLLAIDGKTVRGNASQKQNLLYTVSAYALIFGQVAGLEKIMRSQLFQIG